MTRPRALVYVESLLGVGHGVRAAAVVRAMQQRGFDVTCASGSIEAGEHKFAGAKLLRLPTVKAADAKFSRLVDENGTEVDDAWCMRRRTALLEAYRAFRPQVILIEGFPFSRWQFRFELSPLIEAAKGQAAIVCSVRDIIVAKRDPHRINTIVELIQNHFDMVLVHGDETLVEFSETFPSANQITNKLRYTGYVSTGASEAPSGANGELAGVRGEVLVSAGGGAVGYRLLRAALEARASGALDECPWRILTGQNMPENEISDLRTQAGDHKDVVVEQYRSDFPSLLNSCSISISQAGYNTIVDLLVARARAVVVPFSTDSETEQTVRAHLLEERCLVTVVRDSALTPHSLANALAKVAASQRPPPTQIALDGAARSADLMYTLALDARAS
jgi:predicted glycosyltransferase